MTVRDWRRSPVFADRPDPTLAPADGDNNSWAFVRAGAATLAEAGAGWRLYRAVLTPRRRIATEGGRLNFAGIAGRAQLFVDGKLVGEKTAEAAGPLAVDFPRGDGERTIVLMVSGSAGQPSGLVGGVTIQPKG